MPSTLIDRKFTGTIGWRLPYPGLDDFVVGANATWSETHDLYVTGSFLEYSVRRDRDRAFSADIRLSGERRILPSVVLRAGTWAPFTDTRSETHEMAYGFDYARPKHEANESRLLDTPGVVVGAGWHHAPITFDAQCSSSLALDYLIVRWALTFELH
jgi:hypothetical protein